MYISGYGVHSFIREDKNIEYLSKMGNNMTPYPMAIGENNTHMFITFSQLSKTKKLKKAHCSDRQVLPLYTVNIIDQNVEKNRLQK